MPLPRLVPATGAVPVQETSLAHWVRLTEDDSFEKWIKDSQLGGTEGRKNGSIIVYDFEGREIKRYTITNAWPRSLEITTLKAGDVSVLTEKLVLTYERAERAEFG